MTMMWNKFLERVKTSNYDNQPMGLTPLLDYKLITVSGADSEKFLQGQCTCDFTLLNHHRIILGAHCTPKGRMNSSFHAMRINPDTIGLRVHASIAEHAKNALNKYAVFSKVEIDISERYYLCGFVGNSACDYISNTLSLPKVGEFKTEQGYVIGQHNEQKIELWSEASFVEELLFQEKNIPLLKNNLAWSQANIRDGVGEVTKENIEKLLPQELNFQSINGIAFNKGCYTGQEIIARLHYRGQLKKQLYYAEISSALPPNINDTITSESGKGVIINITQTDSDQYVCLALCDKALYKDSHATLAQHPEAKILWQDLPYAITE